MAFKVRINLWESRAQNQKLEKTNSRKLLLSFSFLFHILKYYIEMQNPVPAALIILVGIEFQLDPINQKPTFTQNHNPATLGSPGYHPSWGRKSTIVRSSLNKLSKDIVSVPGISHPPTGMCSGTNE